jgi:hypothetical protein
MFATKRGKPQTYLLQVSLCKKKVLEYHRDTSTNMAKTKKSNEKLKEEIEGLICYGNYHSYLCGGAYELKEMLGFFTMRTQ